MLAHQYHRTNQLKKAEIYYQKAYNRNPGYEKGLIEYAQFLLQQKKFAQSMELIEELRGKEDFKFDYYFIKGQIDMERGKYSQAIDSFQKGNEIYNSHLKLLNSLGYCYYKTGQKEQALEVLKASLNLNKEQKEIKKLVEKLKKGS